MTDRMFEDRADAGRQLAAALPKLDPAQTVVLALPRGGVPVAVPICEAQQLPLDLVFVRKIGAPGQPEVAVGAIVAGDPPTTFVNDRIAMFLNLDHLKITKMGRELLPEIARREALYRDGRPAIDLTKKTVVLVDDGVATGATLRASLQAIRGRSVAKTILALPVAPPSVLPVLQALADEVICLHTPENFIAVGASYRAFRQTTDAEVVDAMRRFGQT